MGRNKFSLFLLLGSVLLQASLAQGADTEPNKDKPLVVPNTALALPEGCNVKVRWVSPPLDPQMVEKSSWYGLRFAADSSGRPWIGYQDESVISPVRHYRFKLPQRYTSLACIENGAMLVTTESDLCFVVPPKKLEATYNNIPTALYQPIANLPVPGSKLYPGAGNSVYLAARRKDGGSDVYLLSPDGQGVKGYVKVFTSPKEVSAVTGDAKTTFVALGGVIVKVLPDGTVTRISANPQEYIRQLAYLPGTGLFYCSHIGIGYIGAKGTMQFMAVPDAQISLQKGTLYVLFSKSLGVIALDNIADLKKLDRAVKEVPVTDSQDVKITSIRFFEAGKDLPEYEDRKFAAEFSHETSRYVYCQVDIENLQYNKRPHKQAFRMEIYRAGREDMLTFQEISFDCKPEYTGYWGWARFGSEEAGTFYPSVYTVKTYLNGTLVNESKFTITGEPDLIEAARYKDAAMVSKLIKAGADVNMANKSGYTPLMFAALTSNAEIAKLLIEAGANVNAKADDGNTALTMDHESWQDDPTVTQMLIAAGADVNAQGKDGKTALHKAVDLDKLAVIKLLLERGAKTDLKDKDGLTPLLSSHLTYNINPEAAAKDIELLLTNGADPETKDKYGNTALFHAIEGRNATAVSILVKHGADVNATGTEYGVTEHSVLGYALEKYKVFGSNREDRKSLKEILALLQAKGADFNTSEFSRVYFPGIDRLLDLRHMVRLLEMSEPAARNIESEDPYLRKASIRGLLNAACRQISDTKDEYGYYSALNLCEEAANRARKWGLSSSCSEISFNMGLINLQVGSSSNAIKYLKEYLDTAPTGPCAARARELMSQLK